MSERPARECQGVPSHPYPAQFITAPCRICSAPPKPFRAVRTREIGAGPVKRDPDTGH